jgi:hypothetical protein
MFKKNEPTRLGEVLLNKGLISSEQLAHAIKEQASRRKGVDLQDPAVQQATSLGEILIALDYIDRLQLQRGLNWQAKLRKMTIAMALCAPFMSLSTGAAAAVTKIISAVPAVVEAEEYASTSGTAIETTYDAGGGSNVKSIEAGDYLNFSNINVDLPFTGTYIISYRVSSVDGGSISFNNEGSRTIKIDTITVPKTGGAQTWVTVQRTVSLKSGDHFFSIKGVSGSVNLNWIKIEAAGASSSSSVSSSAAASSTPPTAASTTPTVLSPITIQAENYSAMSGVYNEPTTDVGGGQDTGNINTGDWMKYTNTNVTVPVTGVYKVTYRVASLSAGGTLALTEASTGEVLNTVSILVTGGWQKWVDVTSTVKLTAGTHTFGLKAIAGGFNVNWFRIEGTASISSSSTSSVKSSSSSSSSSSKPAVTSSSLSSSSSSKAVSSVSSTTSSSSVVSTAVAGPVGVNWTAPNARLDGTVLDMSEIGGYEIRYKKVGDANFTYVSINDAYTNQYNFSWLEGNYVFQIAAFDKSGIYSNFVDIVSAN